MAREFIRKPSFNKIVGAYRSQWKRFWMRLFTFGLYGRKGMGWIRDPKRAWYNFWYYRTSIGWNQILGYKPTLGSRIFSLILVSILCTVAAPVDVARAGVKAHKIKKRRKERAAKKDEQERQARETSEAAARQKANPAAKKASVSTEKKPPQEHANTVNKTQAASTVKRADINAGREAPNAKNERKPSVPSRKSPSPRCDAAKTAAILEKKTENKPKETYECSVKTLLTPTETAKPSEVKAAKERAPDENTPKSKPKQEGDQYIRKRMLIAGASYCDRAVLERLQVGTYFDLALEPDNPYDKNAVKFSYQGEKIGYVAKKDQLPFVTGLKLKRKIYGVITAIVEENNQTKYEFETWFDQH